MDFENLVQRVFFMLDGDKSMEDLDVQIRAMCKTLEKSVSGDSIEFLGLTVTKIGSVEDPTGYKVWAEVGEFPAEEVKEIK